MKKFKYRDNGNMCDLYMVQSNEESLPFNIGAWKNTFLFCLKEHNKAFKILILPWNIHNRRIK